MGAFGGEGGGRGVLSAGQRFGLCAGVFATDEQVERGILLYREVGRVGFDLFGRNVCRRAGNGAVEAVDMDLQRAGEGGDRGEQPLLQPDEGQPRLRPSRRGRVAIRASRSWR